MVVGVHPRRTCQRNSSSKISLTPHTQNLINLGVSQTGTIFLAITGVLMLVSQTHKINVVVVLVEEEGEMAIKHLVAEPRVRSLISMWKMSRVSRLWTIKRHPLVEAGLLEGGEVPEGGALLPPEETNEEVQDEAVSMQDEEVVVSVVEEEAGGTGKR